jgi:hypothetical protein
MAIGDDKSMGCNGGTVCPVCGGVFACGMRSGAACWCAALPPLTFPPDAGKGCYCPDCLKAMLAEAAVRTGGPEGGA